MRLTRRRSSRTSSCSLASPREKQLAESHDIFDADDRFEGIYFVKSGIVKESAETSSCNRTVGSILALRALVLQMNGLINRSDATAPPVYGSKATTLKESYVYFFDKDSLIEMVFSNEELFDMVYKMYYQTFVLETNVGFAQQEIQDILDIQNSKTRYLKRNAIFELPKGTPG